MVVDGTAGWTSAGERTKMEAHAEALRRRIQTGTTGGTSIQSWERFQTREIRDKFETMCRPGNRASKGRMNLPDMMSKAGDVSQTLAPGTGEENRRGEVSKLGYV